jgi:wyosine [tRNA(Phe)-imidazoG37] synthetase (radical SAM superfamily)
MDLDVVGRRALSAAREATVRTVKSGRDVRVEVSLHPNGACPFACDYCEFRKDGGRSFPEPTDLQALEGKLRAAFERHGRRLTEIVFTGPGEPTWSPQFEQALTIARACVRCLARQLVPVRVLTCGATLHRESLLRALEDLVRSGEGEVWIKLDAWDEESFERINGARAFDRAIARIVTLARRIPVVLRMTVGRRTGTVSAAQLGAHLEQAVRALVREGACIERVELGTVPSDTAASEVAALGAAEIAQVATAIALAVPVRITP